MEAVTILYGENLIQTSPANASHLRCFLFNGDQNKCDIILDVRRGIAALSFIGSLFVILIIWLFKKYVVFAQRLILYLSIAALFDSGSLIIAGLHPDGPLCDFKSWISTYFDWCVLLWVCAITLNLYLNVVKSMHTDRLEWVYSAVSWGVSFVISMLPFIGNHYGPAGMWCWIKNDWKWRFGIWYCPLFMIIVFLFFVYTYITVMIKKKISTWEGLYNPEIDREKQLLKEDVKPLRFYPCVFLAVSVFPLINRIQNAVSDEPVFALVLLHAMTGAAVQGACNALLFGLDKETRSRLTYANIKMAVLHRGQRSVIREYPKFSPQEEAGASPVPYNNVAYSRLH